MVEIAQNASGQVGDYVNDEWIDLAHFASYQNAAHSLATVSMFAAVVESAFRDVCLKINHPVPFEEGRTGGLTADIMVVVNQTDLVNHLTADLRDTLEAVFEYRNKMLHCGFEWPKDEIRKFNNRRQDWPEDWFGTDGPEDSPWMFYMTDDFIAHCQTAISGIIHGLRDFLVREAARQ